VIFGIAMVRDEEDVIEDTVRHMAGQVDRLVIADNLSTDGTRAILDRLATELPLTVLDDLDPGYYQSAKTSALANVAANNGATWVCPFDADELWSAPGMRIADFLGIVPGRFDIVHADLYDHVATAQDDPTIATPMRRLQWRRTTPVPLPKVACRIRQNLVIHQGNHGASYDHEARVFTERLMIHHFPYRTREQFTRKARNGAQAYAATDLPDHAGAHWRQYGAIAEGMGDEACSQIFDEWFWSADPVADGLVHDPVLT
jgi:glycosyltransferase involved in cell wall biosynthesis